jgi:hypothetical protein
LVLVPREVARPAEQRLDGTKEGLKAKAGEAMAMPPGNNDLALVRRYSRTTWRWVGAYHRGLGGPGGVLANYAVRKSKYRRCVTDTVDLEVKRLAKDRMAQCQWADCPRHSLKWQLRAPCGMRAKTKEKLMHKFSYGVFLYFFGTLC